MVSGPAMVRRSVSGGLVWHLAALGLALAVGLNVAGASPAGAGRSDPLAQTGMVADLVAPVPLGEEGAAGPWRMRVVEVLSAQAATDLIVAANAANEPPREGITYLAIRIAATNAGLAPLALDTDDFAALDRTGAIRRFVGAFAPAPAIDATVEVGASHEGWVVLAAPTDAPDPLLLFDSLSISGNWADRAFALGPEPVVPPPAPAAEPRNEVGADPADPAAVGERVVTGAWAVEILEVSVGDAVYALYPVSDYRTTALGAAAASDPDDADGDGAVGWLAVRVRVTNLETDRVTAHLPATALVLAGADGEAIPDTIVLTPPSPDASGAYVPGTAREGWVAFELPAGADIAAVRFLLHRTGDDPRYLVIEG